jgi:hypothetical protein
LRRTYGTFGPAACPSYATINRTTAISSNGAGVTHDGTSIYVQRTGYYAIMARTHSGDNLWDSGRQSAMHIITSNGSVDGSTVNCAASTGGGGGVANFIFVLLSAGHQVYFQTRQTSGYTANYDAGFWDVIFVPTDSYP